ncbi:UNKNOWN [Stylonychia lemnae]|uniref:Transmembrane protein n=1 Tax=Stylonychia lemnae TaxID=5949 RepID=A0A078B4P2_STYLE|nr:UNKNOWN [Stylonychia lemnae]|eukprot:CDW88483.1 UNKNOWN [Stylonychia lemnae]
MDTYQPQGNNQQQNHYVSIPNQQKDKAKRQQYCCCCVNIKSAPTAIGVYDIIYFIGMVLLVVRLYSNNGSSILSLVNLFFTSLPRVIAFTIFTVKSRSTKASAIMFWVRVLSCIPITFISIYLFQSILSIETNPDKPSESDGLTYFVKYVLIIFYIIPQTLILLFDYYFCFVLRKIKNEIARENSQKI